MIIILIRHAKSSWKFDLKDHDRPLAQKGINDAHLVFNEIKPYIPNEYKIWCSTSNRTTQTLKLFTDFNDIYDNQILFKSELYTFDSNELENIINKNIIENLIIFGHNNAITDFVNKFGNFYIENVPTCGIVILKFDDNNIYTPNKGVITKTIFPRDLK
jgi:phosphohistidine phosphatase